MYGWKLRVIPVHLTGHCDLTACWIDGEIALAVSYERNYKEIMLKLLQSISFNIQNEN